MRPADRAFAAAVGLATAVLLAFVALPVVAIFTRVPVSSLLAQLRSPVALDALRISLEATLVAMALILVVGTPAAYLLGTRSFRGRELLIALLELPLVLPPAVAGIGLFAAFGRFGLLGGALRAVGVEIPFTLAAVVMALTFVSLPFYVRQSVAGFAAMDERLLGAARSLGAGPGRTFFRVAVPLAGQSLSAGAALAFARALGEFGATIMFAGSLQGSTQTLPLAVYAQFSAGNLRAALAIAALLVAVSAGLLVAVRLALRAGRRSQPWTSRVFSPTSATA